MLKSNSFSAFSDVYYFIMLEDIIKEMIADESLAKIEAALNFLNFNPNICFPQCNFF